MGGKVGWELEKFFRYTRKQWGIDPSELDKSVTPAFTRTNRDAIFHRHVSGNAAVRIYPDVREDVVAPEHQNYAY